MSILISWDIVTMFMNCFPNSVINHNAEFIAHIKSNTYFGLKDCENETLFLHTKRLYADNEEYLCYPLNILL